MTKGQKIHEKENQKITKIDTKKKKFPIKFHVNMATDGGEDVYPIHIGESCHVMSCPFKSDKMQMIFDKLQVVNDNHRQERR